MSEELKLFQDFDQIIRSQYDKIPLRHLGEINIDKENSVSFFSRIIGSKQSIKPFHSSYFKMFDELCFISKDVKYFTSLLYFFRPYITNASNGTYYQTQEDRRYMTFSSICFQSVYNYWDRMGDLLNLFFETGLPESSIYFSRVLNNFPKQYQVSENYKWLNETFQNEIKEIFGIRDGIVHSYQLEAEYYWRTLESHHDNEKTQELQRQRESFPEQFKYQMDLMNQGFETLLNLTNELPDKELKEDKS